MKYAHQINGKDLAQRPEFWDEPWLSEVLTELELSKLSPEERSLVDLALIKEAFIREEEKMRMDRATKRAEKRGEKKGMEKGEKKGMEKGIEKGIEKGMEKGKVEGIKKSKVEGMEAVNIIAVRNMTKQKFAVELIVGILEIPVATVTQIQQEIQKEPDIRRLLKEGKLNGAQIAEKLAVSPLLVEIVKNEVHGGNGKSNGLKTGA